MQCAFFDLFKNQFSIFPHIQVEQRFLSIIIGIKENGHQRQNRHQILKKKSVETVKICEFLGLLRLKYASIKIFQSFDAANGKFFRFSKIFWCPEYTAPIIILIQTQKHDTILTSIWARYPCSHRLWVRKCFRKIPTSDFVKGSSTCTDFHRKIIINLRRCYCLKQISWLPLPLPIQF